MADNTKLHFVTKDGLKKLKEELKYLKEVKRREIAADLKKSIEFGDLSENAEYQEAKEAQAMTELRIRELDEYIKNVQIIEEPKASSKSGAQKVALGSKVKFRNITEKEEHTFTIVGSTESNPMQGTISNESPIGEAMLGKQVGEKFEIKIPAGTHVLEIIAVD